MSEDALHALIVSGTPGLKLANARPGWRIGQEPIGDTLPRLRAVAFAGPFAVDHDAHVGDVVVGIHVRADRADEVGARDMMDAPDVAAVANYRVDILLARIERMEVMPILREADVLRSVQQLDLFLGR